MTGTIDTPQLSSILVERAMHSGVFTCHADASGLTAARIMAAHRVHSVVVVDDDGTSLAVVTEADIAAAIHADTIMEPAAEIGAEPVFLAPDDSVLRAAQLMHEHERSHAVVIESNTGRPIGVLSVLDLVDLLAADR
jgi:CBS domain-containing protein